MSSITVDDEGTKRNVDQSPYKLPISVKTSTFSSFSCDEKFSFFPRACLVVSSRRRRRHQKWNEMDSLSLAFTRRDVGITFTALKIDGEIWTFSVSRLTMLPSRTLWDIYKYFLASFLSAGLFLLFGNRALGRSMGYYCGFGTELCSFSCEEFFKFIYQVINECPHLASLRVCLQILSHIDCVDRISSIIHELPRNGFWQWIGKI